MDSLLRQAFQDLSIHYAAVTCSKALLPAVINCDVTSVSQHTYYHGVASIHIILHSYFPKAFLLESVYIDNGQR